MYKQLLNEMKKEVCQELSRRGFGEYNRMLYSLELVCSVEEELVCSVEEELVCSVEELCLESVEELCLESVEELCLESVEELCLESVEELCLESVEELCLESVEELCLESVEELCLESVEEELVCSVEELCLESVEELLCLESVEEELVCSVEELLCLESVEELCDVVLEVKKDVNSKVILPWCGEVLSMRCNALVLNGGLYTQCMKCMKEGELYCKVCMNKKEKNGDVFVYGTVEDRLTCDLLEYKDSKGKCEVIYSSVMKKEGISREEAEVEAGKLGWVIPDSYFEVKASKRGRPKKNVEKEDIVEKKVRGRPKKEKETIVGNVGEDLIASLIEETILGNVGDDLIASLIEVNMEENVEENSVDEECEVIKFEYNGRCYLKSEDNVLFDIESHDFVGVWNGSSIDDIKEEEA